jgi:hypothetical protein
MIKIFYPHDNLAAKRTRAKICNHESAHISKVKRPCGTGS